MLPNSVRRTLLAALAIYTGPGQREAVRWAELEPFESLSAREIEVVRLVATGITNQEIADILVIAERTVRSHMRHILDKLDMKNRTQLAIWAIRQKVVIFDDDEEHEAP